MPEERFTCPLCGAVSRHPEDVAHRYCGRCHLFPDDATTVYVDEGQER